MPERRPIGLDNDAFRGRLRQPQRRVQPRSFDVQRSYPGNDRRAIQQPALPTPQLKLQPLARQQSVARPEINVQRPIAAELPPAIIKPQPYARPAQPKQQRSRVLRRLPVQRPNAKIDPKLALQKLPRSPVQIGLIFMGCFIFVLGLVVSLQTLRTNHDATAQVAALAKSASSKPSDKSVTSSVPVPSTTRPSTASVNNYTVAPDAPRYLNIPRLGIHNAIILNLGILSSGALATPPNVYESGWYNQSAKPGQLGAMLIDGHVSSWTTHGVFYGLNSLRAGDKMSVTRGDGSVFNYQVVGSKTYPASGVDMQAAVTPITTGKPGLNLITCTGSVKPGTSEFNERILVFSQQI